MAAAEMASADAPDREEDVAVRRGPKLAIAAVGAAWLAMAVLGVTLLRPELAAVGHAAERAAAAAGPPLNLAPFADPDRFAGRGATPAPSSSPPAVSPARPAQAVHTSQPPASAPSPATTPARTTNPTPATKASPSVPSALPSGLPSAAGSGGSAYPSVPSAVSTCSQAASGTSIGSIIKAIQACAAGLASH